MNLVALKMLVGDRAKYLGIIMGLTFASLLITQQLAIFFGLMSRSYGAITDMAYPDIWVMDSQVQFIDDVKPLQDTELYRVRGIRGVEWAVPLYKGLLKARLETVPGFVLATGEIIDRGVTPMRSFVAEPMQYGRLYLAGDAAHIVPPTGAKGLNLAVADVRLLTRALAHWYETGSGELLDGYSEACLKRVWRAQHFSWWMTTLLHTLESDDAYGHRLQLSYLDYVTSSEAAATTLAENYVGLPYGPAE